VSTTTPCLQFANPIWQAATTRQQHLAYGDGPARRYYTDVVPLAALADDSPEAIAALTAMVEPGERVWFFEEPPALDPQQWRESNRIPGYRMVLDHLPPHQLPSDERQLAPPSEMLDTKRDAAAMNALKAIAFPGFFGMRTPEMGRYRGIRIGGELIAMAGERLAIPGYREVSAVCTHPAHLGRGYAQRLTREATETILADGDIPFLHVAGGNARAIAVYERLGYVRCADVAFVELARLG
jgi:ribosomal protein S18 acetylase RimI-like enzyme